MHSRFASLVVAAVAVCLSTAPVLAQARSPAEILGDFVRDYAADRSLTSEHRFGVRVDGAWWQVSAKPANGEGGARVDLATGEPTPPTYYFTLDAATLAAIDRGELNSLTAMGKARASDAAPMDIDAQPGFQPGPGFLPEVLDVAFHFWTRGFPERVPFGAEHTRTVHGGQATVFFYQPGFRSAWFQIRPGQHVNAEPRDQTNPFPSLLVATRGRARAKIGGVEIELVEGEALFIPPDTTHELWNPYADPAEGVLLMFGDGA